MKDSTILAIVLGALAVVAAGYLFLSVSPTAVSPAVVVTSSGPTPTAVSGTESVTVSPPTLEGEGEGDDAKEEQEQPDGPPNATPVPGQPGRVYSPFASGKEVDVQGYPPGTEVKCPWTSKAFRVP